MVHLWTDSYYFGCNHVQSQQKIALLWLRFLRSKALTVSSLTERSVEPGQSNTPDKLVLFLLSRSQVCWCRPCTLVRGVWAWADSAGVSACQAQQSGRLFEHISLRASQSSCLSTAFHWWKWVGEASQSRLVFQFGWRKASSGAGCAKGYSQNLTHICWGFQHFLAIL